MLVVIVFLFGNPLVLRVGKQVIFVELNGFSLRDFAFFWLNLLRMVFFCRVLIVVFAGVFGNGCSKGGVGHSVIF